MNMRSWIALLLILVLISLPARCEDEIPEQDVVVDQMYAVEEFAVTDGLPDSWVNILLMGMDTRSSETYGKTDAMIIFSVNLGRRQVKLTSLLRDIWVTMDGRTKAGKLNSACEQGGPELAMRTVNECFGMNIDYYVIANLRGLAEIIDILGGLDLDVTAEELNAINKGLFDLSSRSGMEKLLEYGSDVHLNGNQATAYARIYSLDSDTRRTWRDREVLRRIARRIQQETGDTLVGVVMALLNQVETNMNLTQIMTIAAIGLETDLDGIQELVIPVEGTYQSGTYKMMNQRIWCIKPDFNDNTRALHAFIYGGD